MELILARQSVIIKCRLNQSIMMGNYEYYYAAGLLCRLAGAQPQPELRPDELSAFLKPLFESYKPLNDQESYLVKLLKEYKVSDECDGQMAELLQMGLKEQDIWVQMPAALERV